MNRSRDEFLPRAGLAGDEHRRIAAGDLAHARESRHQRRRGANDFLEHRRFVDLFSQGDVFLLEPILGFEGSLDTFRAYRENYDLACHEFAFDVSEFQQMDRGFSAANRIISSPMTQPTKLEHRLHLGGSAPFSRGPH